MIRPRKLLIFCLLSLLATTAQSTEKIPSIQDDAIPTNTPLPLAGVNQRPVIGVKKVLLVAAHWQGDDKIDMQKLYAETASEQPGSISDYIKKASTGKLTFNWTTITASFDKPYPGFYPGFTDAEQAAQAQGYDPKSYDYIFIFIGKNIGGQADMPGNMLIVGAVDYGHFYWAHEFGHNLGFNHGKIYTKCRQSNDIVFAPDQCEVINPQPYASTPHDPGDPVNQGKGLFPANYRWFAGWLDNSQAAVINKTGLYRLGVLGGDGPQLYLIDRGPGQSPQQIALEYRQPNPPYDNFPPTDNRAKGVWVRYTTMGDIVTNLQLDATPETATTTDTLLPGKVLKDETAGITVTVCTASRNGATIAVSVNGEAATSCTKAISPPIIQSPAPGIPAAPNPIIFSGTSLPGALINVSYKTSQGSVWKDVKVVADATGVWQAPLPSLSSGKYNGQVWQTIGNNASLANFRNFEVAP